MQRMLVEVGCVGPNAAHIAGYFKRGTMRSVLWATFCYHREFENEQLQK